VVGDLKVRPAELADAEAIARVHVDSWRAGYRGLLADEVLAGLSVAERELMWRKRLTGEDAQHDRRRVDVAVARGAIVGFVAAGPSQEQDAPARSGEIYAMYVHPDRWSMGVGQALMSSAVDHLAASGAAQALLWVLASNARARCFYELAGWGWDGRTRSKRLTGLPDFHSEVEEVCYRRQLPPADATA
jgi:ribosomal protein S18 acetylase RimI-like enzyme